MYPDFGMLIIVSLIMQIIEGCLEVELNMVDFVHELLYEFLVVDW